jgi:SAM-dependent methyltransferase
MALRGRYQGVTQIIRFNWPFYAVATFVLLAGACVTCVFAIPPLLRLILSAAIGVAVFWLVASLIIAHYIYDRAGIYNGTWIRRVTDGEPKRWATFHAGLEEFSEVIREQFPHSEGSVFDFFDRTEMTEPSIQRARQLENAPQGLPVDFRALPLRDGELETAFVLFSAHELRKTLPRARFFQELRRILRPHGQIVLVEHLRDWPNFFAFGPGCFHFHSRRTWLGTIQSAGLFTTRECSLTPFVRVFVLAARPSSHV